MRYNVSLNKLTRCRIGNTDTLCVRVVYRRYPAWVWTTPFGFPVLPDVYNRKSMSSLSMTSGSHSVDCFAISCQIEALDSVSQEIVVKVLYVFYQMHIRRTSEFIIYYQNIETCYFPEKKGLASFLFSLKHNVRGCAIFEL